MQDLVELDDRYLGVGELAQLVQRADVVLLPYDSREQVTSGVLIEAVAAGRPVVSTAFPHAIELLADETGIVVPQRDPAALAAALRRVLSEPGLADGLAGQAARKAPELLWAAVAGRYRTIAAALARGDRRGGVVITELVAPVFTHLRRLTDAGGLYEHAAGIVPRREHGYCVDDVARGLVVVCREPGAELDDLREQYLSFVLAAQVPDGRFHNRRHADRSWPDAPSVEDCWGRALWGLGTAVARAPQLRRARLAAFDRGAALRSPHRRAMAFAALGAAEVLDVVPQHAGARGAARGGRDVDRTARSGPRRGRGRSPG